MPAQFVGSQAQGWAGDTTSKTVTYALTGGIDTVPRVGDVVFLTTIWPTITDFDTVWATDQGFVVVEDYYASGVYSINHQVFYKVMTDPADTGFTMPPVNTTSQGYAFSLQVWRDVYLAKPIDTKATAGQNAGVPPPVSVTPTNDNVPILFLGGSGGVGATLLTNANLLAVTSAVGNDSTDGHISSGYMIGGAAGDPVTSGSWSGGPGTSTSNRSSAVGISLWPADAPRPTIDFVGAKGGQNGGTVGERTVALDNLTGGIASAPSPGDIVFLILADVNVTTAREVISAGWTKQDGVVSVDTQTTQLTTFYKVMGDPVDVDVTFTRGGSGNYDCWWQIYVMRGVHPTEPMDAPYTTDSGNNASRANPPAITPVTPGAVVLATGAGSTEVTALAFTSADLSNFITGTEDNGSVQINIGTGTLAWGGSGAVDPAAFGLLPTATSNSWCARSIALRPVPTGGLIKVWDGSAFVEKPVKVYDGAGWVEKPLKYWTGTEWALS